MESFSTSRKGIARRAISIRKKVLLKGNSAMKGGQQERGKELRELLVQGLYQPPDHFPYRVRTAVTHEGLLSL